MAHTSVPQYLIIGPEAEDNFFQVYGDKIDRFLTAIRNGNSRFAASKIAGINEMTLRMWMKKAHADQDTPYYEFLERIEEAEAHAEASMVASIVYAARPHEVSEKEETIYDDGTKRTVTRTRLVHDWKAARAWLAARRPEWKQNFTIDVRAIPDDQLLQLLNSGQGAIGPGNESFDPDEEDPPITGGSLDGEDPSGSDAPGADPR